MKIKNKIIIFIIIILNIGVIYLAFLIGKNHAILTNNQIECLAKDILDKQIIVSEEQAICLAKNKEIEIICGIGCPIKRPNNSTTLSLKSGKSVLLENDSIEFTKQMEDLGVRFFKK